MAAIDSLCVLVELDGTVGNIKQLIRTYESRARAEEDLELLRQAVPGTPYIINDIHHIER